MDMPLDKILVAFISAIFGIVAAMITPRILDWRNRRRITKALLWELENLLAQVDTIHPQLHDALHELTLGVWDMTVPMNLTNPVYSNFYKDICSHLTASQAFSFGLIHGTVDRINRLNERLSDLCEEGVKNPEGSLVLSARQKTAAQYENIRTLEWHIRYHIRYSDNPELGNTPQGDDAHRQFRNAKTKIQKELDAIIETAMGQDAHAFRKKHKSNLTIEVPPPEGHS